MGGAERDIDDVAALRRSPPDETRGINRRVRIGVVGVGRVGQIAHLAHYAVMNDVELALADLRPRLSAEVAARFGIARVFADHAALLADGVDGIVVVVRRAATGPIVLEAIDVGTHVLSEKPMALTYDCGLRLVSAARRARVRYGVGYMKRSDAGVQAAREQFKRRLADRSWGEFLGIDAWSCGGIDGSEPAKFDMTAEVRPDGLASWPARPPWLPPDLDRCYDELLNVHIHIINLVRWFIGEPIMPTSATTEGAALFVEAGAGVLPVHFELRDDRRDGLWHEGLALRFAAGTIRIDLPAPFAPDAAARVTERGADGEVAVVFVNGGGAFARQARAFVDWIIGVRTFPAEADDALYDLQFAEDVSRLLVVSLKSEYR